MQHERIQYTEDRPEPSKPHHKNPVELILESRETTSSKRLDGGSNDVLRVQLRDDGAGIFKPKEGERLFVDREDERPGTFYRRERAAYLVNRFLDMDLVPPTTIRSVGGVIGSIQEFIPDALSGDETSEETKADPMVEAELIKLWLFDYLIYNSDRHGGNYLIKNRKVYAIDNGLTFGRDPLFQAGDYRNAPVPKDFIEKIQRFISWEQGQQLLVQFLEELLPKEQANACLRRIRRLGKMIEKGFIGWNDSFTYS